MKMLCGMMLGILLSLSALAAQNGEAGKLGPRDSSLPLPHEIFEKELGDPLDPSAVPEEKRIDVLPPSILLDLLSEAVDEIDVSTRQGIVPYGSSCSPSGGHEMLNTNSTIHYNAGRCTLLCRLFAIRRT